MSFEEYINFFDFGFKLYSDGYGFIDFTGANLGNIESERYDNPINMINRLVDSIYFKDYVEPDEDTLKEVYEVESVESWYDVWGEDSGNPMLYYGLHPDKLEDIPPVIQIVNNQACIDVFDLDAEKLDYIKNLVKNGYCEKTPVIRFNNCSAEDLEEEPDDDIDI